MVYQPIDHRNLWSIQPFSYIFSKVSRKCMLPFALDLQDLKCLSEWQAPTSCTQFRFLREIISYIWYCDFLQVTSAPIIVPSSSLKPTVQSAKKAEDDLEDWLDSVLGWLWLFIFLANTLTIVTFELIAPNWSMWLKEIQLVIFINLCVSSVLISWAVQLLYKVHSNPGESRKGLH